MRYFVERNEVVENYALALHDIAIEKKIKINEILDDLIFFNKALKNKEIKKLKNLLSYPLKTDDEKIASIHDVFDGSIDEIVIDFLILLTKAQRLSFLPLIIEELKKIYFEEENIIKVKAKFGIKPSLQTIEKIKAKMQQKLGCKEILFEFEVDEKLIGGVKLFYQGKFIDNTLAAKIKRYAQQIRS